jgi:hypothetical protein
LTTIQSEQPKSTSKKLLELLGGTSLRNAHVESKDDNTVVFAVPKKAPAGTYQAIAKGIYTLNEEKEIIKVNKSAREALLNPTESAPRYRRR